MMLSMACFAIEDTFIKILSARLPATQILFSIGFGGALITFLIAFLGWMPAPLDVSIWQSIWSLEKDKGTLKTTTTKQAIFDFNVGYVGTIFLAVCFVILGALVMYNSGESFSTKGDVFASQLIALYTQNLGKFTYIFISIAAFTTMFSTTITTLDASPRTMSKANDLLFSEKIKLLYGHILIVSSAPNDG